MLNSKASTVFERNYYTEAGIVINQGGANSGKTYAILQLLFCLAAGTANQVITVTGQDIPNLKAGAMRDAINIWKSWPALQTVIKNFNKTDRIFEFSNGSLMEFKSYDDSQDAKSGKRDYLFVNEANGINWDVYTELALRTRKRVYIDYNPNTGFWAHQNLIGRPGVELIISDHRHNPFISAAERARIEDMKNLDESLWKVYARGLTGKLSGLIFTNWGICEVIPDDATPIAAGLDFGFTNDETGCLMVYKQNGELWIEELFYATGLTNTDIAQLFKQHIPDRNTEIVADCAEPKSIEELRRLGWRITAAKKGADSVTNSIDILKRYRLNVTRNSINLRSELEKYMWRTDRDGRLLNQPVDHHNHLIDPLRYVALNKLQINNLKKPVSRLPYLAPAMVVPELNGML